MAKDDALDMSVSSNIYTMTAEKMSASQISSYLV